MTYCTLCRFLEILFWPKRYFLKEIFLQSFLGTSLYWMYCHFCFQEFVPWWGTNTGRLSPCWNLSLSSLIVVVLSISRVWFLWPHRGQHARLPCPLLSPRVCSNSCPLHQWYYLCISSSVALFFCLQSSPTSGAFPMSQMFASGVRSIGASASTSVLPMNIQGWFPLGWTGLISLQSKGLWQVFSTWTVAHQAPLSVEFSRQEYWSG